MSEALNKVIKDLKIKLKDEISNAEWHQNKYKFHEENVLALKESIAALNDVLEQR